MIVPKPQVFLDHAHKEDIHHLSKDRLVIGLDCPLSVDTPIAVTIVCGDQNMVVQGLVESMTRRDQNYVGTIIWQDDNQKQALDTLLLSAARHFEDCKVSILVANTFHKENHLQTETLSQAFLRRKRRGYLGLSCLVVLLMVGVVWGIWQTFFRIYVDPPFAAVTVPLHMTMAPEFGQVMWDPLVLTSQRLNKGQILGTMDSPKLREAKEGLENDLSFLKIHIEGLREKKKDAALRASYRQKSAQNLLRQKEERLRAAQSDYEQAKDRQKRLMPLHKKGYLSQIKWDTLQAEVTKAKTMVNEARAVLDQTQTDTQMIMASLDDPVGAAPQDLDQEISEKLTQRENLLRQRRFLDQRFENLTLTSPCDCRIVSFQSDKAWINSSATLMRLQDDSEEALVVEARVPASVADRIQIGNEATIALGETGEDMPARVVDIRPIASTERYGLSPMILQDPSLTSVYLKPIQGTLKPHKPGTHASVSIHKATPLDFLKKFF